jgi:hypothetical protein
VGTCHKYADMFQEDLTRRRTMMRASSVLYGRRYS